MKCLRYNDDVMLVCEIPICGCGTPEVCYEWLIEYLTDLEEHNWDKYDYDSPEWKYVQIINRFLEQLDLVEHGTTCRCSWLTEKGRKVLETLKFMKKYEFDFNPDDNTEYGKWFWVEQEKDNE